MKRDFTHLSISIFENCAFNSFSNAVNQIEKKEIESSKIEVLNKVLFFEEYFNPKGGGSHYHIYSFWVNRNFPNKIFFISNCQDGRYTLCNVIHHHVKGNLIMCTLSNDKYKGNPSPYLPAYSFHYSDENFNERWVLAYKEDRWVFYEKGQPLNIENTSYYKNRLIKKRLNNIIIEEYLQKLGVDLWDIDNSVDRGFTYIQHAW